MEYNDADSIQIQWQSPGNIGHFVVYYDFLLQFSNNVMDQNLHILTNKSSYLVLTRKGPSGPC